MTILWFGSLFLNCLLESFQLLAHLRERVPCRIGFLSAFLGGAEIGFLQPVFLILMTVSCDARSMRAPIFLAEVAILLGSSYLRDSGRRLSTRLLVSFLALVGSFLVGLCIGIFLRTYVLYSLKRHKKLMHVHGSHTLLVKVEVVLPRKWAHRYNMTCQISLHEQNICLKCIGHDTGAVEPAW